MTEQGQKVNIKHKKKQYLILENIQTSTLMQCYVILCCPIFNVPTELTSSMVIQCTTNTFMEMTCGLFNASQN